MSDLLTSSGWMTQVKFQVPAPVNAALKATAAESHCSKAEVIRRIVEAAIPKEPPAVVAVPEQPRPPKPKKDLPMVCLTPIQLFERGHKATQIAAILKMPYAQVFKAIGTSVDAETREGIYP